MIPLDNDPELALLCLLILLAIAIATSLVAFINWEGRRTIGDEECHRESPKP